jgi:hypothetical protein
MSQNVQLSPQPHPIQTTSQQKQLMKFTKIHVNLALLTAVMAHVLKLLHYVHYSTVAHHLSHLSVHPGLVLNLLKNVHYLMAVLLVNHKNVSVLVNVLVDYTIVHQMSVHLQI